MPKKSKISLKRLHAIEVTRIAIGDQKLVYVLVADKKFKYPFGRSAVAYIGTTKLGIRRVASSAAGWAETILSKYSVRKVTARIITCAPRKRVKTWVKLERALLLEFRRQYGDVPACNSQGWKMIEKDEFAYFSREAVRKRILELG